MAPAAMTLASYSGNAPFHARCRAGAENSVRPIASFCGLSATDIREGGKRRRGCFRRPFLAGKRAAVERIHWLDAAAGPHPYAARHSALLVPEEQDQDVAQ